MNNREFSKQLEERTKKFAVNIIKLSSSLSKTQEGNVIKYQISKSGTSVGANYREANCSRSKADFYNKIKICQSEANETIYWLELIMELNITDNNMVDKLIIEGKEIFAIFSSIANNLKKST